MFYKISNIITKIDLVDGARDFRLMEKHVADSILDLTEYNHFSKGLFQWIGYDINGWNMKILKGLRVKPVGLFGNYLNIL